jgi:hypothetical protein
VRAARRTRRLACAGLAVALAAIVAAFLFWRVCDEQLGARAG